MGEVNEIMLSFERLYIIIVLQMVMIHTSYSKSQVDLYTNIRDNVYFEFVLLQTASLLVL